MKNPYVAIVDDDSSFSAYLRTFLSLRGYEARCYTRGDELLASMSIQNPQTGELPVHESMPDGFDTAYGSYAVFSWIWCQQLWHDERFEQHIRLAAKWLGPKTDLARDSQRWYPKRIENGVVPDWEAKWPIGKVLPRRAVNARVARVKFAGPDRAPYSL